MTTEIAIAQAASRLMAAHRSNTPCLPIRDLIPATDIEAAYAVQQQNTRHWLALGRRPVGRKIALAARAIQQQMGLDQPAYGMLFADTCLAEGAEIYFDALIQPKLETEIALVLERPLNHGQHTVADIISAVAYAVPAFEIVGCRIAGWDVSAADFIADNSAASMFVLGSRPKKLSEFDIVRCRMITECQGEQVSLGTGAACLGNPLNAVVWLADKLAQAGQPMQPGDIIMSGSLGPMAMMKPGDVFDAQIEGLGGLSLRIS